MRRSLLSLMLVSGAGLCGCGPIDTREALSPQADPVKTVPSQKAVDDARKQEIDAQYKGFTQIAPHVVKLVALDPITADLNDETLDDERSYNLDNKALYYFDLNDSSVVVSRQIEGILRGDVSGRVRQPIVTPPILHKDMTTSVKNNFAKAAEYVAKKKAVGTVAPQ